MRRGRVSLAKDLEEVGALGPKDALMVWRDGGRLECVFPDSMETEPDAPIVQDSPTWAAAITAVLFSLDNRVGPIRNFLTEILMEKKPQ